MASELFLGAFGGTVSALMILLMLCLMISMSLRLFLARRKKAYFSLTFSLLLIVIQYIAIVLIGSRPDAYEGGAEHYIVHGLQTLSFIALNAGIYQLYNRTKRKVSALIWLGVFLTLLIMGLRYYAATTLFADPGEGAAAQTNAFLNVWMDLYLYAILMFCFYFVTPAIGQSGKYQLALVVYFLTHTAAVLNGYIFGGGVAWLGAVEHYLPVAFYFIVFLLLFERVLELMQAVYHSAITDGLTGLHNRRYFMRRLQQQTAAGPVGGVVFADIDNFKKLNDAKGHQRGDEALCKVAAIAMEIADDIGIAGRYGGEEIVLFVAEPDSDLAEVAERLRARVEAEAGVTISVGWARHRKGTTAEKLTKMADEAMYVSKKSGKNRVTGYKPGLLDKQGADVPKYLLDD